MSAQAPTVAKPHRLPLITQFTNRDESFLRDARLVNGIAEKDLITGEWIVEKRPGLTNYYNYGSGAGLGTFNWQGNPVWIVGSQLYVNATAVGTVDTSNGQYRFIALVGNPPYLVLGNGVHTYYTDGSYLWELPLYTPIQANALTAGSQYTILTSGTTDWIAAGSLSSPVSSTKVYPGSYVIGNTYIIENLGTFIEFGSYWVDQTQDFTQIGASSNTIGLAFTATGTGNLYARTSSNSGVTWTTSTSVKKTAYAYAGTAVGTGLSFTAANSGNGTGTVALNAVSITPGQFYRINSLYTGTGAATDFTLLGASANTVGTTFFANSTTPSGTGTVFIQSSFPITYCKGFAYLDGTLYVMDHSGTIWGSANLNDPTLWDSLNFIQANDEPDGGVALAKQLVYVIALTGWGASAFFDAGNPVGSPLAPVPGAKSPYGCQSADSVQEIDDILFWITANKTASPQIAMMDNLRVSIVSTPSIERALDQISPPSISSWAFKHGGHRFYGINATAVGGGSPVTLVYDIDQKLWYQWTDASGGAWPVVSMTYQTSPTPGHIAQSATGGHIYQLEGDYEYPTDMGSVVPVDIITINEDFGIDRRKVLNVMRFNADQKAGSIIYVRCSDDDYQSWSQWRAVDLSQRRPTLTKCGTFYRRAWWIRHIAATPFRIRSVDLQMDIGTL